MSIPGLFRDIPRPYLPLCRDGGGELRHGHVRPHEEGASGQGRRLPGLRALPSRGLLLR